MLGGIDSVKENPDIVWDNLLEWDGNEWSEISAPMPDSRMHPFPWRSGMTYDSKQKKIIIFSVLLVEQSTFLKPFYTNETWEFSFTSSGLPKNLWSMFE